ncbi:MAG: TetR/AcrR family transcriptional regulator [Marmoricola sp.]
MTATARLTDTSRLDDRDPVLDAALAAFLDFGIRRTSMGEIARRAGISPATLYRRYAQKSDVVMAVGLREAQRELSYVDHKVDQSAPPLEQLVQLYSAVAHRLRDNQLLQRVLATEPETVLPRLTLEAAPLLDIGHSYLAAFLTRLQSEGHLPTYDVTPVADFLTRVAQSEILTPALGPLDDAATRAFVRDHLAPFIRLNPEDSAMKAGNR